MAVTLLLGCIRDARRVEIKECLILKFFSAQPLCSLCLAGDFVDQICNQRDTENTEVAQRKPN